MRLCGTHSKISWNYWFTLQLVQENNWQKIVNNFNQDFFCLINPQKHLYYAAAPPALHLHSDGLLARTNSSLVLER